tara:strand:- start:754 stop:969 length:216 start_codon:yes stop_codon:yes gene_type:complete
VKAIQVADPKLLGVRLGNLCVAKDISVTTIAAMFNVSRQTVYWWFIGRYKPRPDFAADIEKMLATHEKDRV